MSTFETSTVDMCCRPSRSTTQLGASRFLATYGFGSATENLLWHEHRSYDSKAVLGVALRFATGTTAASDSFHGGEDGAADVLRALDFEVSGDDDADGHWTEASDVGVELARAAWADAARGVLVGVAKHYRTVITYKELPPRSSGSPAFAPSSRSTTGSVTCSDAWPPSPLAATSRSCPPWP